MKAPSQSGSTIGRSERLAETSSVAGLAFSLFNANRTWRSSGERSPDRVLYGVGKRDSVLVAQAEELILEGGAQTSGVVRVGATVRRPLHSQSSYVQAVIRL
jgi:hypothetical protein